MSGQRPPPSETEFPKDFFKVPTMNKLPQDDAAERAKSLAAAWFRFRTAFGVPDTTADYAMFREGFESAWKSATEAAAKKCEERIESLRRILREHAIHEFPDEQMMQCGECGSMWRKGFPEAHSLSIPEEELCAAAIRGNK